MAAKFDRGYFDAVCEIAYLKGAFARERELSSQMDRLCRQPQLDGEMFRALLDEYNRVRAELLLHIENRTPSRAIAFSG